MNRCDFSSVIMLIKEYISDEKLPTQVDLLYELFNEFIEENMEFDFDEGQVCRWFKGHSRVSPRIINYYLSNKKRLIDDIENNILPLMYDVDMALQKLIEMVVLDKSISDRQKDKLCDPKKSAAVIIADILSFTFERPFIKKDNGLMLPVKNSPILLDYIMSDDVPKPCKHFCGRDKEMEMLHSLFKENSKVFLQGIAGIGKSETAKAYARKYKSEYRNILFISYSGNLKNDIIELDFVDDLPSDTEEKRFKKHNRFMRSLGQDTLIIIDNFNATTTSDEFLPVVLKYRCNILFTTRSQFSGKCCFQLNEIEDIDILIQAVSKLYSDTEHNVETVVEIINAVHSHTFAVELVARLLENGILEPKALLKKLKTENVKMDSSDKIGINKDGKARKATYYNHVHTLFELYRLSEQQQDLMCNMTLMPLSGISSRLFANWLRLSNMNDINDLIELGFIKSLSGYSIALHPIIREIVFSDIEPSISKCRTLCESIENICLAHGQSVSYYRQMFIVTENIMVYTDKDDISFYLRFIEDVFPYMENYNYQNGMGLIIVEMERLLKENSSVNDKALLLDYKATCEKKIEKQIKFEKEALSLLKEITDENAHLVSNINANLGGLYRKVNNYELAEKIYEERN